MKFAGYELDPFQEEAIRAVEQDRSIIVSAPTGAGKTLIAEYVVEKVLRENKRAIYTAPIKALSNQKYRDFNHKYGEKAGIVTGDVSLNSDAPLLVMTTEILRNSIFENPKRLSGLSWVIFDEVHYIDDVERGTVWEEAIIFAPPGIRFLCLSATVPNLKELSGWMEKTRGESIVSVLETKRPVPLENFFLEGGTVRSKLPSGRRGGKGRQNRKAERVTRFEEKRHIGDFFRYLEKRKGYPCLYFVFSRARTEYLPRETRIPKLLEKSEEEKIVSLWEDLIARYRLQKEPSAQEMEPLIQRGIGYHHAGMLPSLKEVIERLFTSGLLKLIFTTETFALGINMPARTVVLDSLRKYFGTHFGNLRSRDYHQMVGRAGRRGMDKRGFAYTRIDTSGLTSREIQQIVYGKPEPIRSQFDSCYATILNLYPLLGDRLPETYDRSFHHFQSSHSSRESGRLEMKKKLNLLKEIDLIQEGEVTPAGRFACRVYGFELIASELFTGGILESLDEVSLNVLLLAIVHEPRKGERRPPLRGRAKMLSKRLLPMERRIRNLEKKHHVRTRTKKLSFSLSPAMEAWVTGIPFIELCELAPTDPGGLVRCFRMTIQILREIGNAPQVSPALVEKTRRCLHLINREEVDAERQLRTT